MTVQINAYDPGNNGIGIYFSQYLSQKFASFDNVSGTLSTDTDATEYAFIGADGGGVIFHSLTGWTVDPDTGNVTGTLDSISFGQNTLAAVEGTFSQTAEMTISGIDVSGSDLQTIFDQASDGKFNSVYTAIKDNQFSVVGSSSKDSLIGGNIGGNVIHAGAGDDVIDGSGGYGDGDGDRLYGDGGNDRIIGSRGDDVIVGGTGDDIMYGGAGNDNIGGGAGNNVIKGGDGNDLLIGEGDDKLYGEAGNDHLYGSHGRDRLYGGTGNDTLSGGLGIDTFIFQKEAGNDMIYDFKPGKASKDVIVFDDVGLTSLKDVLDHATQGKYDVVITYDEGTLLLRNVKLAQFDSHDFMFS